METIPPIRRCFPGLAGLTGPMKEHNHILFGLHRLLIEHIGVITVKGLTGRIKRLTVIERSRCRHNRPPCRKTSLVRKRHRVMESFCRGRKSKGKDERRQKVLFHGLFLLKVL